MDRNQLTWLFFSFSGRLSRAPYFLAGLLLAVLQLFPLYQLTRVAEESGAVDIWATVFWGIVIVSVWPYVALSVKRFHDFGKPGILAGALFIPVISIITFVVLCVYPGDSGGNEYGEHTNAPR